MEAVLEVKASEFKAKCLQIFRDLEAHRLDKVIVTRRGKPVAELRPSQTVGPVPEIWGCMRGSVIIPEGVDLTDPVLEDIPEAESGEGRF